MSDAQTDSIEEVLQQSSEQTLKLTHIDEGVRKLEQTVSDLGDTLQAGLLEVRNLAAQKPQTPAAIASGDDAAYRQAVIERLDQLEEHVSQANRKLGILTVLTGVTVLLALVTALVAFNVIKVRKPEPPITYTPPPPAAVAPAPPPAKESPPPEINLGKSKKRR